MIFAKDNWGKFNGVLCLLILILFGNLKKYCLFYVSDTYVWTHVFQKQPQKALLGFLDIELEVLQNSVKKFSFRKAGVHLQLY